jgi:K+-sensing histidine kinase KdpD
MTHDIKNLLQALRAITSAVEHSDEHNAEATTVLLQRQLPLITQRLQLSLDKLQAPAAASAATATPMQAADTWWQTLVTRNAGQDIKFVAQLEHDRSIPVELFDTVAENLIENARFKRQTQTGIRITVRLHVSEQHTTLQVSDDGTQIAEEIKRGLFCGPVESASGHGIGLYQAARLAQGMGYQLRLVEGEDRVVFELRSDFDQLETLSAADGSTRQAY